MAERRQTPPMAQDERKSDKLKEIKTWLFRISNSRKKRDEWKARYKCDELATLYLGPDYQWSTWGQNTDIHINKFFPAIKAMMPGMFYRNPTFFVKPKPKGTTNPGFRQAAAAEALLEAIARQDNHLKLAGKLALQQSFFYYGALKSIYDPKLEPNPQKGEPLYLHDENGYPLVDIRTGEYERARDENGRPMREPDQIPRDETYRWQWVNACNLLLPDEGPDRSQWTWIGEEICVPLEDAQDDERFPVALRNLLRHAIRPMQTSQSYGISQDNEQAEYDKKVWYTELWDIKNKRHLIVAEGQSFQQTEFLLDDDYPDGVEDDPYSLLWYTPQIDPQPSPYPVPPTWNWLPLQREYNTRRNQMIRAANRSARKVYYSKDTFPNADEAQAAMQSSKDMEGILLNDSNHPPVTLSDPSSPPDIAKDLLLSDKDWRETVGLTGPRLSNTDSNTATEALLEERAASQRDASSQDVINDWMKSAGTKMWQLVQGTMTIGMYIKLRGFTDQEFDAYLHDVYGPVYGPQAIDLLRQQPGLRRRFTEQFGQEKWIHITRDQITFEAEIDISPGSAKARLPEVERPLVLAFLDRITVMATQAPEILTSRTLLKMIADLFEVIPEQLIDELQMIGIKRAKMMQQALMAKGMGANGASMPASNGEGPLTNFMAPHIASLLSGGG